MPQKHQTPCRIRKKPVSLQHHYIANNMEYLKRTADEHLSLLREPDLLMVIKGGEMAYTRPDGVKIIPLACLKDVSVSAMLVSMRQKNIAQVSILERYFFVSTYQAAGPDTCLAVFVVASLPPCL